MSIYFFSLFPLCPIKVSSLSKNLIFQIQHKRYISIYTSIQEGFYYGKETLIFTQKLTNRKDFYFSFLLIYIALLAIPYIQHKNVSVSYQKKFAKQSFYSDTAGTERVAYINDNTDALLYRLHMFDEAKDEIILSTFDFNADKSGQDMMASLLHAADRGVSVRIYNPINLLKPWNLQARMHDKYVIVDQKMYLARRKKYDKFISRRLLQVQTVLHP